MSADDDRTVLIRIIRARGVCLRGPFYRYSMAGVAGNQMMGQDNCLFGALTIAVTEHGRNPLDHLVQPLSTVFWVDAFLRMRLATFAQADFDAPRLWGGMTAEWRWATSIAEFDRLLDKILTSERVAIVRAVAWPFSSPGRTAEPIMPIGDRAAIVRSRNAGGYLVEDPLLRHQPRRHVEQGAVAEAATSGIALLDYRFCPPPPLRSEVRALLETSLQNLVRVDQPGRAPAPFGLAAIDHLRRLFAQRHLAVYDSRHFRTMVRYYLPVAIRSFVVTNREWFGRYCGRVPVLQEADRVVVAGASRAAATAWEDAARRLSRAFGDGGGAPLQDALVALERAEEALVAVIRRTLRGV